MAKSPRPPTFLDSIERLLLRIILVALAVLALLLGFAAWHARHGGAPVSTAGLAAPRPAPASSAITLTIDYGDGTQKRFTDLAFTPGMTVLDAMNLARSHARPIAFAASGSGESTLVGEIDGVANEGVAPPGTPASSGGKPRNWQYWVNDRYGEASIGVAKLQPGDRVSWAFRPYGTDTRPPPP